MGEGLQKAKRIFFLDNLKAFIVCLMIVFHAAMCYMAYAPQWWYTVDTADVKFAFTLFVMWADIFIMPVMFFIAGYFGISSLAKYSAGKFWRSKWLRVGLPWIAGVVLFAPPVTYLMFATRDIPLSYHDYLLPLFVFGPCFSHVQYWFLGMLMWFYLALLIVCRLWPACGQQVEARIPSVKFFVLIAVLGLGGTVAGYVLSGYDYDLWTFVWPILVFQPPRLVLLLLSFFMGVYAWRCQWFTEGGYRPDPTTWLPAFIVTGILYLLHCILGGAYAAGMEQYAVFRAAFHILFFMSSMFGLLALFQAKLNFTNGFLGELAANSYTMYYAHMGLVMLIAWGFKYIALPTFFKYAVVACLSLLASYLVSKILLLLPCFAASKKAKKRV